MALIEVDKFQILEQIVHSKDDHLKIGKMDDHIKIGFLDKEGKIILQRGIYESLTSETNGEETTHIVRLIMPWEKAYVLQRYPNETQAMQAFVHYNRALNKGCNITITGHDTATATVYLR